VEPKKVTDRMSRRKALGWIAAAPAAAAVSPAVLAQLEDTGFTEPAKPHERKEELPKDASDDIKCLVKGEDELSGKERKKLAENLEGLQNALDTLRGYDLADDVEPAFEFRAMRAAKGDRS